MDMPLGIEKGRVLADPVAEPADEFGDGGLLVDAVRMRGLEYCGGELDLLGDEGGRDPGLVLLGTQQRLGDADGVHEGLVEFRHRVPLAPIAVVQTSPLGMAATRSG